MLSKNSFVAFIVMLIFTQQDCYGQLSRGDSLFYNFRKEIKPERVLPDGGVSWDGETQEAYFLMLCSIPIETLARYVDDSIPAVRAQVFAGLTLKRANEQLLRDILSRHANDTARFKLYNGDLVITRTVKEEMQFIFDHRSAIPIRRYDFEVRLAHARDRPNVLVPGTHHGSIYRDSLVEAYHLNQPIPGYRLVSFSLVAREIRLLGHGDLLTKKMRRIIRKLKPGERIFFDDVKVEGSDGRVRNIGSSNLRIK